MAEVAGCKLVQKPLFLYDWTVIKLRTDWVSKTIQYVELLAGVVRMSKFVKTHRACEGVDLT